MEKLRTPAILFAALVVALAAVALVSANAGYANVQNSSNPGVLATPAPTEPPATQEPLLAEVLTPVVSEPVPTGRGLFDEITDRLLRALLNFF
jgi:hypothetical protein